MALLAAAAFLAARAAVAAARGPGGDRGTVAFWAATAAWLGFLALNKQVDLQLLLIAAGRCLSEAQGWADLRGPVKRGFVLATSGAIAIALAWMLWRLGRRASGLRLALLGHAFIALWIVQQAAWHSHMHLPGGTRLGIMGLDWLLELPGPVLILAAAALSLRRSAGRGPRTRP